MEKISYSNVTFQLFVVFAFVSVQVEANIIMKIAKKARKISDPCKH